MTKSDEVELLNETIAGLPDSYLRDILIAEKEAILSAISNDMCFIDLNGIQDVCRTETEELKVLQDRRSKVQAEVADLERKKAILVNAVSDAKDQVVSLSRRLSGLLS